MSSARLNTISPPSGDVLEIGLVIHGPEAIDSGLVRNALERLKDLGRVQARLGGTMGSAAVIDAGLEEEVEIDRRQLTSQALLEFSFTKDLLVLVNQGKIRDSGLAFGYLVTRKVLPRIDKPLVQVDDGFVVAWNEKGKEYALRISELMGLEVMSQHMEETVQERRRRIHGVLPGENIWINGSVIGKAVSSDAEIVEREGKKEFRGIALKPHGLEHLGDFDLQRAVIRSGSVRRTAAKARQVKRTGRSIVFIDHDAENVFERSADAKLAVVVGDDTTRIAGSLLYRWGIPIVGIVDGDEDEICKDCLLAEGSEIITVPPGMDAVVGGRIKQRVFHGKEERLCDDGTDQIIKKIKKAVSK